MLQLIVDLATYERAAHEVKTTTEQLRAALFGPQPATYALVAEWQQQVVGLALYFRNFSTWEGVHGLYLEDLYVMGEYRGFGLGSIGTGPRSTSTAVLERALWTSGRSTASAARRSAPPQPRSDALMRSRLLGETTQRYRPADGQHESSDRERQEARGNGIAKKANAEQ